jgi:thiol:disulfide interchange protein DsbC
MMNTLWPKVPLVVLLATGTAFGADSGKAIVFGDLPLDFAVTEVRGSGRRVFATFEDPYCIYCKRLASEIADMNDVTIHTFMYPVLTADSVARAKAIWCSSNRAKAWRNWMLKGTGSTAARCNAEAIDELLALGRKLKVRATPTIFFADGTRITGALSKMELEMAISSPQVMAYQADLGKKKKSSPR